MLISRLLPCRATYNTLLQIAIARIEPDVDSEGTRVVEVDDTTVLVHVSIMRTILSLAVEQVCRPALLLSSSSLLSV